METDKKKSGVASGFWEIIKGGKFSGKAERLPELKTIVWGKTTTAR